MEIILDTHFNNSALPVRPSARFYDDFTGGGGDYNSLGVTHEERPWEYMGGEGWFQREDNTATGVGRSELAVVNGYSPDGRLTAYINRASTQDPRYGLALRVQDSTNFLWLSQNSSGSALNLYEQVNSINESIGSAAVTLQSGDTLEARLNGTTIHVVLNNELVFTATSNAHQTATKHGLFNWNSSDGQHQANPRWDWVRFTG